MPPDHICLKEQDWGKPGGFRDRLFKAELDIKALKERFWQSSLIGGLIGALIGSGSRDIIVAAFKWIMGK